MVEIISSKPYHRWVFVVVTQCGRWASIQMYGALGLFRVFIPVKNWLSNSGGLVTTRCSVKALYRAVTMQLPGLLFGWSLGFRFFGYHFRAERYRIVAAKLFNQARSRLLCSRLGWFFPVQTLYRRGVWKGWLQHTRRLQRRWTKKKFRRLRRTVLVFRFGFFYDIMVLLPLSIQVYWRKRFFILRGSNLRVLQLVSEYIRFTRELFPYKRKGFAFENETILLKVGKKVKRK